MQSAQLKPDHRVPGYLGRALTDTGEPVGTCFQVAPGVAATAWHVVHDLSASSAVGSTIRIDPLRGGEATLGHVLAVDCHNDLAILRLDRALPQSIVGFALTDNVKDRTPVAITGAPSVADKYSYRFLSSHGTWAGASLRDESVRLGRLVADAVMPGMSGAPVIDNDGLVVGIVSGRYNSVDGWLQNSVWAARTEDLLQLLDGIASVDLPRGLKVVDPSRTPQGDEALLTRLQAILSRQLAVVGARFLSHGQPEKCQLPAEKKQEVIRLLREYEQLLGQYAENRIAYSDSLRPIGGLVDLSKVAKVIEEQRALLLPLQSAYKRAVANAADIALLAMLEVSNAGRRRLDAVVSAMDKNIETKKASQRWLPLALRTNRAASADYFECFARGAQLKGLAAALNQAIVDYETHFTIPSGIRESLLQTRTLERVALVAGYLNNDKPESTFRLGLMSLVKNGHLSRDVGDKLLAAIAEDDKERPVASNTSYKDGDPSGSQ